MKKILIVSSMLFAFADVFGMQISNFMFSKNRQNPIIGAVRVNDISRTKQLINNVWDDKGRTVTRLLLAYKYKEAWSESELQKYLDLQEQRVKNALDYPDDYGNTPLMTAIWSEHVELVKYLVDRGANINLSDSEGDTPLLMAVWTDHSVELVKYLVEHGADINEKDMYGSTPLIIAVEIRNKALVEYLIGHGADVDAQDEYQDTPLLIASKKNYFELVKYLVENGADVNKATVKGNTPLWMAAKNGHVAIVRYLLNHGADANIASENIKNYIIDHTVDLYEKDDIESIVLLLSEYIRYRNILRLMRIIQNIEL